MANYYTNIVYLNDGIDIIDKDNYKSVVSTKTINTHTLLLVEHVFTGTNEECHLIVRDNEYLFNTLHPRSLEWENESNEDKDQISLTKLIRNCYGKNLDNLFICDFMSKINHSCIPNTVFFRAIGKNIHGLQVNYIALVTIKEIAQGEEITINYGIDRGHDPSEDFCCMCEKTETERTKICSVIYGMAVQLQKNFLDEITKMVNAYEEKTKKTLVYQYLAKKGLVVSNDDILSMKKSYVKYLNSLYVEGTIEEKNNEFFHYVNDLLNKIENN
jgi:hypothetical protein